MEPKGNLIELGTFLKCFNRSEKSSIVDIRPGSKYASGNITSHFLKEHSLQKVNEIF